MWQIGRALVLSGLAFAVAGSHAPLAHAADCSLSCQYVQNTTPLTLYCDGDDQNSAIALSCEIEIDGGCTLSGFDCDPPEFD